MKFERSAGIILHPSSLPGPDGIGDLGPEAYRWIDFLVETGCRLWQVLPLGPTGYGDSPYQCFSAFAGNPYLVSPALLLNDRILRRSDLVDRPTFPVDHVDFGEVIQWKLKILDRAYKRFKSLTNSPLQDEFDTFIKEQFFWIEDFTLFMALKDKFGGGSWYTWPAKFRKRQKPSLATFSEQEAERIERHKFRQFLFFRQWNALKKYANDKHISIIGDIPIFISSDSSDAWSHPELFFFDQNRKPTVVAGVPPDYFSPTGQLWGNPLYKWSEHKAQEYSWWISRMKATLQMVDIVRMDHFRGFAGYWEIPIGMPTAEVGRWVKGPGAPLFKAIHDALGNLPIIAEDLGVITQDVVALREKFQLPGMRVFQFAFSTDPLDPFLPHNYVENCVAYTGTHDNDTAIGWYNSAPDVERDFIRRYLDRSGDDIAWDMIRAVWSSVSVFALAPLQDVLSLGTEARMNLPGRASGNWAWRMSADALNHGITGRLKQSNYLYARSPIVSTVKKVVKLKYHNE